MLAGAAAIPYRLDTSVTSLMQDEQRVQVSFNDGSSSYYDLVVGADGISSIVRQLLMGTVPPDYTGLMIWRSLVPIPPPDPTNFRIMFGDGCFFGITPLGEGPTNVFGVVGMPRTHDPLPGRLERFRKRFAGFGGHVQECLAAISSDEQIHCEPSEVLQPDHWHHGRVVLIGDAAHAAAPTMAQRGNQAMRDSFEPLIPEP